MAFLGAKSAGKCPGVAVGAVLILRPLVGATHEVDRARRRDDDEWSPVGAMMLDGRPSARLRLIIARRRDCNWILPVGARRRDDDERSRVGAMMMDGRPSARLRLIIARQREDDGITPVGAKMMDNCARRREDDGLLRPSAQRLWIIAPVGAKIMDDCLSAQR